MPSGVKIRDLNAGEGAIAEHNSVVVVHLRGFLHRGEECCNSYHTGVPIRISLAKRDHVAGLRKGIEGMRVGGRREMIVSPHLAYGQMGVPPNIPPNAVIRFEVELLEIETPGQQSERFLPSGKQLLVFHPGEAARNLPRWQFGLLEGKSAGATITFPLPGLTWRHARVKQVRMDFDQEQMTQILSNAEEIFAVHKGSCLRHEDLWADASEKANSITRDRHANSLCVSIQIWGKGLCVLDYALPEKSPILIDSFFYTAILEKLTPEFAANERDQMNRPIHMLP